MREVGGFAATYCPVEDVDAWHAAIIRLLRERHDHRAQWTMRSETGVRRAAAFSWSRYASDVVAIYARMINHPDPRGVRLAVPC
jgi:hypothetical protein